MRRLHINRWVSRRRPPSASDVAGGRPYCRLVLFRARLSTPFVCSPPSLAYTPLLILPSTAPTNVSIVLILITHDPPASAFSPHMELAEQVKQIEPVEPARPGG